MLILHELTVLRRLQTNMCSPCSIRCGYTQASARSRALATAWSRAYCAITLRASNTLLTMDHDRELAECISPFR